MAPRLVVGGAAVDEAFEPAQPAAVNAVRTPIATSSPAKCLRDRATGKPAAAAWTIAVRAGRGWQSCGARLAGLGERGSRVLAALASGKTDGPRWVRGALRSVACSCRPAAGRDDLGDLIDCAGDGWLGDAGVADE